MGSYSAHQNFILRVFFFLSKETQSVEDQNKNAVTILGSMAWKLSVSLYREACYSLWFMEMPTSRYWDVRRNVFLTTNKDHKEKNVSNEPVAPFLFCI